MNNTSVVRFESGRTLLFRATRRSRTGNTPWPDPAFAPARHQRSQGRPPRHRNATPKTLWNRWFPDAPHVLGDEIDDPDDVDTPRQTRRRTRYRGAAGVLVEALKKKTRLVATDEARPSSTKPQLIGPTQYGSSPHPSPRGRQSSSFLLRRYRRADEGEPDEALFPCKTGCGSGPTL